MNKGTVNLIRRHAKLFVCAVDLHVFDETVEGLQRFWDGAWGPIEAEFRAHGMTMEQATDAVLAEMPVARFILSLGELPREPHLYALRVAKAAIDKVIDGNSRLTDDECAALSFALEALNLADAPHEQKHRR
jgi:hypothetical protein